jgi:type IV secretory pathway VirB2 component (pilin)
MLDNKEVSISVNKAKTLKMKLIYVVAAVAMLAMLIPAMAVPVSAAPAITMYLVDPVTNLATVVDGGYDVTASTVEILVTGATVTGWGKLDLVTGTNSAWVPDVYPGTANPVRVTGVWGETNITAQTTTGPLTVNKKWGQIASTDITASGSSPVTWYEGGKYWYATQNIPILFTAIS